MEIKDPIEKQGFEDATLYYTLHAPEEMITSPLMKFLVECGKDAATNLRIGLNGKVPPVFPATLVPYYDPLKHGYNVQVHAMQFNKFLETPTLGSEGWEAYSKGHKAAIATTQYRVKEQGARVTQLNAQLLEDARIDQRLTVPHNRLLSRRELLEYLQGVQNFQDSLAQQIRTIRMLPSNPIAFNALIHISELHSRQKRNNTIGEPDQSN